MLLHDGAGFAAHRGVELHELRAHPRPRRNVPLDIHAPRGSSVEAVVPLHVAQAVGSSRRRDEVGPGAGAADVERRRGLPPDREDVIDPGSVVGDVRADVSVRSGLAGAVVSLSWRRHRQDAEEQDNRCGYCRDATSHGYS